ncbi:MAG: PLP-dependent aminotransferase family protein [Vicinamibacterales bacterium]
MTQYDTFFSRAGEAMRESAIRKMGAVLAQARDMISFAPGYPAEDVFPWEAFADIARELLSGADGSVLQYGPTRGYKPLREVILSMMRDRLGAAPGGSIVVTTGSQQGLDLLARVLLDPGDVVLVELPSYTGAISAFRGVGASLVGVRQDPDGLNLEELDRTLLRLRADGRRVKVLYVVPNFQNPTGLLMALPKRPRLSEWAARRDVLLIEDDPYRDLWFPDMARDEDTRPVAADDPSGRVIYLSSFSKTLAPGLRVAWVHAPEPVAAKLELAKQAEDLCTGGLDQRIVYEACRRGVLQANLPALRSHYQNKRDVMVKALQRHLAGKLSWPDPRGGFFLWGKLAGTLQSDALLEHAQKRGVVFVTGSAFFVDGAGQQHLRLSFSAPAPDRIEEGVARLAAAVVDATPISAASSR